MRIFVNNVDGFVGRALCADLRGALGQETRLLGTITDTGDAAEDKAAELVKSMGVKRIVSRKDHKRYLDDVLSCSLIVYDLHSSDAAEVEQVVKHLKVASLAHETTFVLISSVNVWARTKIQRKKVQADEDAEEEDGEEGEDAEKVQDRPSPLSDADLDRRVPSPAYEGWKYLETLVLSLNSKARLQPHVVAAGILYGNGETTFNELFKAAWLTQATQNIIQPGDNYLPCVHVRDVARLVKMVHVRDPTTPKLGSYLIAVDRSKLTQADIVHGIIKHMSKQREVSMIAAEDADPEVCDAMTLDLIMEASQPMKVSSFPWWCRDGLVANLDKVAAEFCKFRNLRPIKMVVLGPPGAGAERLCNRVAERYLHAEPPHFTFEQILVDAMAAGTPAAKRLRRKVDRIAEKRPGAKLPLKIRTKLVHKRLSSNVCRYRGYVLEGYPTSYEEADALFTELVRAEGEEDPPEEEEEEEGEEGGDDEQDDEVDEPPKAAAEDGDEDEEEDPDKPKKRINPAVAPEFVVSLRSAAERCKARIFSGEVRGPASEEEFWAKTAEFQKANITIDGGLCTTDFFSETAGTHVLQLAMDEVNEEEAFQAIRVHMEAKGQFFNYLRSEEERCSGRAEELQRLEEEDDERRAADRREREAEEERLRQVQAQQEVGRKQVIAEGEAQHLDAESMPLRSYLMSHVVPTLSEGLAKVCREQPEDPIEFLAQYLFAHAEDAGVNLLDSN